MNENIILKSAPVTRLESNLLEDNRATSILIIPSLVLKGLLLIISLLVMFHIIALVSARVFPEQIRINTLLDKFFHLNNESNFPTFYSAIQLLGASLLLFFIGTLKDARLRVQNKTFWYFLGFVFLFLTFDEATQIHEESVLPVRNRLPETTGYLYYAWVIPYSIIFLSIGIYSFKFIRKLPATTRNLFLISGFMFVTGAVGLEIFEGYIDKYYGKEVMPYLILITIEEMLEMVSVAIFIYALLDYITPYKMKVSLNAKGNN